MIIFPNNKFALFWNLFNLISIIYLVTMLPFLIAFQIDGTFFMIFEGFLNVFFILDIFINMITSYRKKDGDWEISNKKILVNYLKGYFILDVLTSIPFDLLLSSIESFADNPYNKMFRILKLPKIIFTFKWEDYFSLS